MSSPVRTPQTRSQTKKIATTRTTSSLASTKSQTSDIPQNNIILTIVATMAFFNITGFAFWKYHKSIIQVPKLSQVTDRLIYTLQLQAYSLIPLAICLIQVMFTRLLTTARNPLSGNEKLVEKSIRILTNTVEQFIFSLCSQLILATFIPADYLFVIPFVVFTFTVGRIAFIIGYNIHPKFRTFGFVLTFAPTFTIFLVNLLYVSGLNKFASIPASAEHTKKTEL